MRYLSVCSGIEAATVAWHPLGWQPVAFSEIEPFPCAVLAHHYPTVPNWGDLTRFHAWPDATVDLLVGGTPCQSFSVAGLRKGLDDPRGGLLFAYLAVARRYRPRWLVWENVPGVLSSDDGRAFGSLLGGLAELGYGFAYRVLDAQYFELAQRRARVFVVGHLGDWRRAAAVLFERESLSGHPAPRREAGQDTAVSVAGSLGSRGNRSHTELDGHGAYVPEIVPQAMSAKWAKGSSGPAGDEVANLIAHSLRADGFDASEDGTGRGTPLVPELAQTITSGEDGARGWQDPVNTTLLPEPYTLAIRGRGDSHQLEYRQDGTANAVLTPNGGRGGIDVGAVAHAFDARQSDVIQYGDQSGPLDTDGHSIAVAFSVKDHGADAGPIAPTLRAGGHATSHANGGVMPAVTQGMAVRRLTPRECARLQGFPDDYLDIPYRGKPAADGPKYKALGNSMAVPVMYWIGRRIQMVEDVCREAVA